MGVVSILTGEGHKIPGFSLSLWGDVPLGSGLSSSAALEVVTALAVLSLIGASYPGPVLARLCQRVENEFVGANCGIMDQFISANGKENHALLLDCRDLSYRLAPIPANVALVIANTMVKHSIAGGDYPTRRRESEAACAVIASHRPACPSSATPRLKIWINGATRWSPSRLCVPAMSSAKTCALWPPLRRCSAAT